MAHGVQELRPLNLRAIAEVVGIHESTVSRVTSNKYVATPRGVFELKYFFTSALSAADGGDDHSSEAVRDQLRDLIENETAGTVLSDDKLVDNQRISGVGTARRTVAKYRDALGIHSSVHRRRARRMYAPPAGREAKWTGGGGGTMFPAPCCRDGFFGLGAVMKDVVSTGNNG